MQKNRIRPLVLGVAALAAIVLATRAVFDSRAPAKPVGTAADERAVPVKIAVAERSDIDLALDIIGRVEAFSTVTLRSRVTGQLQSLEFTPGQVVKHGDVVAKIDPTLLHAQLAQAEGVLARDAAQLVKARADVKRYDEIATKGFIAKAELDTYRANLGVAEAALQSDRAAVELARAQLGYATITAPFGGTLGAPLAYPGAVISADTTDLVVLNQTRPINVAFALPEASLSTVRAAMDKRSVPVQVRIPGADGTLDGTLVFVDNAVDASTGTIVLKARFDNADDRLTPGQFVNVTLPTTRLPDAVSVPVIALQSSPTGPFVFVVRSDNTVEQRGIVLGPTVGKRFVVTKGVEVGERIVTEGQLLLVPDAKVSVAQGG